MRNILIAAAFGFGVLLAVMDSKAQVQCVHVFNGLNNTLSCNNGYWRTITPEGVEYVGNGMEDPNALARGGTFNINPTTGGPNIDVNRGPILSPATQPPIVGPGQAEAYGFQPRWD